MFSKKKTPLPAVRRLAGQSLRDEKQRLLDDRLIPFYLATASLWILWAYDSVRAATHAPPQPKTLLALAIVATGLSIIVFRRLFGDFRRLNRGEAGELKVAEALDDLRAEGYRVIHDIVRDGFNIDHVVVGPAGVFAIETKFKSGHGQIEFRNGQGLFVGGFPDENDCLKQARGNAREINRLILDHCGRYEWVFPLVVFVGAWQVKDDWRTTDARVFTPEALLPYLADQQPRLKRSEIALIASHLERSAKAA